MRDGAETRTSLGSGFGIGTECMNKICGAAAEGAWVASKVEWIQEIHSEKMEELGITLGRGTTR